MTTTMEVPIMQSNKPKRDANKAAAHKAVEEAVKEFVGEVEDFHKIDVNKLFDWNYRVNVWTRKLNEGGLSYTYKIERSYFMHYSEEKLTDLTKPPKERPLGSFFS